MDNDLLYETTSSLMDQAAKSAIAGEISIAQAAGVMTIMLTALVKVRATLSPTAVKVMLDWCGDQKIQCIKAIREHNPTMGLKEAKVASEQTPGVVFEGNRVTAEAALKSLVDAGAEARIVG